MRSIKSALQGGSMPEDNNLNMNTQKKIWHLLTSEQRRATIALLGFMIIGMVLETMGVGLVIPALALMTQSDIAIKYPELQPFVSSLGNPSHEQLVVYGMLVLVSVYTVKALFLSFLTWIQMKFVFNVQADLSQKLFFGYLHQPYTFHLQRNSAQLIRNVVAETNLFTHSGLKSGMIILTEFLVLLGISSLLLIVEPFGTLLVVCVLGMAGWTFYVYTRGYIFRWGKARQFHEGLRIQYLQEGLGGVKDVKLRGRENKFLSQYQLHNTGSARVGQYKSTMQVLPRIWLELFAIIGLAVLVLSMIWQGKALETVLPTLGLFAAAAFRLIPSVNRILSAIQSVRFTLPVIDTLYSECKYFDENKSSQDGVVFPLERCISLEKVNFSYPSTNNMALSELNMSIAKGASVGFIGGSGAGKSTLVDIILGLLAPTSGVVKVDGTDIQTNTRSWQDQIGYVPQSIFLTDDSLRRNIAFGLSDDVIDEDAIDLAVHAAQLEDFVKELPQGMDTVVGERGVRLSGGQRQRIGIARALYHDPQVLVLDEATSSLDTATERDVMNAVNVFHGNKTLIIVAHRLTTVEHCDRLYRLENGRVIEEGTPDTILAANKPEDKTAKLT